MFNAMKGVTKALTSLNKKMDLPGLQKIMNEFITANERYSLSVSLSLSLYTNL
jgi:charged multivesicular body protein 2A